MKKHSALITQDATFTTLYHLKHRTSLWFCASVISRSFFLAKNGHPPHSTQQAAKWLMPNCCVQLSLNAQRWW